MKAKVKKFVEAMDAIGDRFGQDEKTATRGKWAKSIAKNEAICEFLAMRDIPAEVVARSRENLKRLGHIAMAINNSDFGKLDKAMKAWVEYLGANASRDEFALGGVMTIMNHSSMTQANYLRTALDSIGALKKRWGKDSDKSAGFVVDRDHEVVSALLKL